MNSLSQSLVSCESLEQFLRSFNKSDELKEDFELVDAFITWYKELSEGRSEYSSDFYSMLCNHFTNAFSQEDPHELLLFIFELLTEFGKAYLNSESKQAMRNIFLENHFEPTKNKEIDIGASNSTSLLSTNYLEPDEI